MSKLLTLKAEIKTEAIRLGFSHFGVASPSPVAHYASFKAWVGEGFNAGMDYLSRPDTLAKRSNPQLILEKCQSVICLALPYHRPIAPLEENHPGQGRVSAYARTEDYHHIIWDRLDQLETFIHQKADQQLKQKSYVDTGPILERSYATRAGIGIAGKNSCLIIQRAGSYFFLAEILTDLPLPVDEPFNRDLCGSCQRCIEACPTGCIQSNRTIDAARCISNLTIEQRGIISDRDKSLIGSWVFGCDACQMVCPHNSRPSGFPVTLGQMLAPEFLDLIDLFSLNQDEFKRRYKKSPFSRTKRVGLLRNAAIVLGNQQYKPALPTLEDCLANENDPGLLDACRWAIREIKNASASPPGKDEAR